MFSLQLHCSGDQEEHQTVEQEPAAAKAEEATSAFETAAEEKPSEEIRKPSDEHSQTEHLEMQSTLVHLYT